MLITFILYFTVTAGLAFLASRTITPMSIRAGAVLVLLPLCFTGRALLTGGVYAPIDLPYQAEPMKSIAAAHGITSMHNGVFSDVYCLNIPWKAATRAAYAQHDLPLWNPHLFAGDILAAAAQPVPYDPVFLSSLLLPIANSLTYLAALAFFLAALGMFLWLRDDGCGEWASMAGAAGWMYAGFLVFWLEWVITAAVLWTPLVLLGVRRVVRRRDRGSFYLLTIAFTMMLLAGHPESALHIVAIAIVLFALELWYARFRGAVRALLLGAAAGVLSLAICAVYLLPILEALPQTMEHDFRNAVVAKSIRSVPLNQALRRLELDFVPFAYGVVPDHVAKDAPVYPIPATAYVGSIGLVAAAYGVWRGRFEGKLALLILFAAACLIGVDAPPLADWLAKLPLFDIAINNRYSFAAAFALAALAAHGVETWQAQTSNRGLAVTALIAAALLAVAVVAIRGRAFAAGVPHDVFDPAAAALLIPPALLGIVLFFVRNPRWGFAALFFLLLLQRTVEMGSFYPTIRPEAFYPPIPGFERLPKNGPPYRIVGMHYTFIPNTATMYGLEDIRGYEAMTYLPLFQTYPLWSVHQPVWFNRVDDLSRPFLSFLNVRYAVAVTGEKVPAWWHVVASFPAYSIFENERVIERAFAPRLVRVNSLDPLIEMSTESDFRGRAWVSDPSASGTGEIVNGEAYADVTYRRTNSMRLEVHAKAPAWIVISETAWKGWKARVDTRRVPVVRANIAFLAVQVPAGRHRLDLVYRPQSWVIGGIVSLLALLGIAADVLVRRIRRRAAIAS